MSIYSPTDELVDRLFQDYTEDCEKRRKAFLRCDTEHVAYLDARRRKIRAELDIALEAQSREKHELIQWADAGYPPVVEHENPLSARDEYIVPIEPTWADWRRSAQRYVETGSKEAYNLMLTMVRLDHPVPNMWTEADISKTISKTRKPLTLADIWYASRWYVMIFTIWAISLVVGINLFT